METSAEPDGRSEQDAKPARARWTWGERATFAVLAVVLAALVYVCSVHVDRPVAFDEFALHNPAYMYVVTGRVSYPVQDQPANMTAHPPTQSLILGVLMRRGLPLLTAAAVPICVAFAVLVAALALGRFSFGAAVALLLGSFCALFVWAEQYLVRPDNFVTFAWFVGLVALQAARNHDWHPSLLALAGVTLALASALSYWGFVGSLAALIGGAVLVGRELDWRTRRGRVALAALFGGAAVVLFPFVVLFVVRVPLAIVGHQFTVYRSGMSAFAKHVASYAVFSSWLSWNWDIRWFTTAALWAPLTWAIPVVIPALLILAVWREMRVIAACGAWLPLLVLVASRDKQIGYTGYFTPEVVLYLVACVSVFTKAIPALLGRRSAVVAAALVGLAVVAQVPMSSGHTWELRDRQDLPDLARAASQRIVGSDAVVGAYSAGIWYTSGAHDLWLAFDDLRKANQHASSSGPVLEGPLILGMDTTWWRSLPDQAPVPRWFLDGRLQLAGFVLGTAGAHRDLLLLFLTSEPRPLRGVLLDGDRAEDFIPDPQGTTTVGVFDCARRVSVAAMPGLRHVSVFTHDRAPAPEAPHMVVLAASTSAFGALRPSLADSCREREVLTGSLRRVPLEELREALRADRPMRFHRSQRAALDARAMSGPGGSPPPPR